MTKPEVTQKIWAQLFSGFLGQLLTQPPAPFRAGWGLLRHLGELLRLYYSLFNAQRFFFFLRSLAQYILINMGIKFPN